MLKSKQTDRFHDVEICGRLVPVRLRDNARARRIILRIDPESDGVVVTLPSGTDDTHAMNLIDEKQAWIAGALEALPPRFELRDGAALQILGQPYVIRHSPTDRSGVRRDGNVIWVSGDAKHLRRRVMDWLRGEARRIILPRVEIMAQRLGEKFSRVSVRDTKSRWGSCTPGGNLSFSWRLIMAPEEILNYVVAHEVSHLKHLNHGPKFWETVDSLDVDAAAGRAWLNKNGQTLMRVG